MKKTLLLLWSCIIVACLSVVDIAALGEIEYTILYKVTHHANTGELTSYTAYSIVPQDESGYWLQRTTYMQLDSEPLSITQTLLDAGTHQPLRYIMYRPARMDRPPRVVDLPLDEMGQDEILPTPVTDAFTDVGPIQVAGGEFDAKYGQVNNKQIWISPEVPVLGVVKVETPEWTMELMGIEQYAEDLLPKKPDKGGMVYMEEN